MINTPSIHARDTLGDLSTDKSRPGQKTFHTGVHNNGERERQRPQFLPAGGSATDTAGLSSRRTVSMVGGLQGSAGATLTLVLRVVAVVVVATLELAAVVVAVVKMVEEGAACRASLTRLCAKRSTDTARPGRWTLLSEAPDPRKGGESGKGMEGNGGGC